MKNKLSITIGIPAHNEEKNILFLLRSILKQKGNLYNIKKIIVICDGCTDNTYTKVKKFSSKYPLIEVINDYKRKGKTSRLNQVYRLNKNDIIITFDADIVVDKNAIEEICKVFITNPQIDLVAAHQEPLRPTNFIGKAIYAGDQLWNEIRIPYNNGNNIHNIFGAATALKKEFAKKLVFPLNLSSDEGFLYLKAKENGGFYYAKNAVVYYWSISSWHDYKLQATRGVYSDKENMVKYFGNKVWEEYKIPTILKIVPTIKQLIKEPFYTFISLILNLIVRIMPLRDDLLSKGMWQIVGSTKAGIKI